MARLLGMKTLPISARVSPSSIAPAAPTTKVHCRSGRTAKLHYRSGRRAPRRLILGLGTSFLDQFARMAAGIFSPFIASARTRGASSVEEVLKNVEWPEKFPFKEEDFQRFDESSDSLFYSSPRFVTHIDDPAIRALTKYYSEVFPPSNTPGVCLLDLCSSWVSHFPPGYKQERIVGMGMNEEELQKNLYIYNKYFRKKTLSEQKGAGVLYYIVVLTEYVVQDLNVNPKLPFEDNSFDVITNVVSVDYLTKPIDIFKEMQRILKPGGLAIMSFSNRCFWTKAISIWTSTGDADHVWIVGSYFHYAGGFEPPQILIDCSWYGSPKMFEEPVAKEFVSTAKLCRAVDISPNPGRTDPMYIVYSRKVATA